MPGKAIDITNKKFGKWIAIRFETVYNAQHYWLCKCDCGTVRVVSKSSLTQGRSKSCGCVHIERMKKKSYVKRHGHSSGYHLTSEYRSWLNMKQRCHNPKSKAYKNYGARGIFVCDRWRNSFENYLTDMGLKPSPNHSLDRIDNHKGYTPDNCRWATRKQQARNKRSNFRIVFNGETKTIAGWAQELNLSARTIWKRLNLYGWSVERTLTTPINGGSN